MNMLQAILDLYVVLCRCKSKSLVRKEQQKLRVFLKQGAEENFGPKRKTGRRIERITVMKRIMVCILHSSRHKFVFVCLE
jgi:hypothetical protein